MNIFVGGVNGIGKSTILRRVAQIDKRFEVVHYSGAVMQQLGLNPSDYEAFHKVDMIRCNQATAEVMSGLISRQTAKIRFIDGHYLAIREGEIFRLAGDWVAGLDGLVLVAAELAVAWERLQIDGRWQSRRIFTPDATPSEAQTELARNLEQTSQEFERWSEQYQKDHFVLTHNDDDAERATRQLINFCDTVRAERH